MRLYYVKPLKTTLPLSHLLQLELYHNVYINAVADNIELFYFNYPGTFGRLYRRVQSTVPSVNFDLSLRVFTNENGFVWET